MRGKIEACLIGGLSKENLKRYRRIIFLIQLLTRVMLIIDAIRYMLASDVLWFMVGKVQVKVGAC
jgi:hypothetical protein